MSNRKKRLQKLLSHPKELAFNHVKTVLNDFGYRLVRINGSHHIFEGKTYEHIIVPVHNGKVTEYYIKDIINIISKLIDYEKM